MTPEEIAEACEKAAGILEGHWMQGEWVGFVSHRHAHILMVEEHHCLEGAIGAALGYTTDQMREMQGTTVRNSIISCPVYKAVQETLRDNPDLYNLGGYGWLAAWNDIPGRTEQEVLDILHKTAKRVLGVEE